jgi:hypothetical protein
MIKTFTFLESSEIGLKCISNEPLVRFLPSKYSPTFAILSDSNFKEGDFFARIHTVRPFFVRDDCCLIRRTAVEIGRLGEDSVQ